MILFFLNALPIKQIHFLCIIHYIHRLYDRKLVGCTQHVLVNSGQQALTSQDERGKIRVLTPGGYRSLGCDSVHLKLPRDVGWNMELGRAENRTWSYSIPVFG